MRDRRLWLSITLIPSLFCVLQGASQTSSNSDAQFSIRWTADPLRTNEVTVSVAGASKAAIKALRGTGWTTENWQGLFSIYAEQGDLTADLRVPSMLGTYRVEADSLQFRPRFALEPGVSYRAVFRPDRLPMERGTERKPMISLFTIPKLSAQASTVVREVYPTADVLPENLLKFYIYFSAPMSRGHIYDHIHLRDDAGKAIELPFLEIDEEFWDPAMMRLTLFIDPGRIKRGVKPLEDVGPALEAGKRYTLRIDRNWKDAAGNPLLGNFQKVFQVAPPDRQPPDPNAWKIEAPKPETTEPLQVSFAQPLDHALALRMIQVSDQSNHPVKGSAQLAHHEAQWRFIPSDPWRAGRYNVVVQNTIEDLAGNNIGKAFEVDLFEGVQRRFTNSVVKVPFEIR